ncbi:TfuA-like core domain-containing protein [Actinobacteria bacterium OK074]|nr:TfuA-like core domain-containing protein [Actinobacteria bacterium OK074]
MSTHVFLGPTLPAAEAATILPAEYHPPVSLGDVYRSVRRGARRILVVDGYFERVPAVWHKEILFALAEGVSVYGCSSMGALRAAELHPYGMVGIGEVFRAYRDGELEDDDDVAVAHGPAEAGFRRLSEAMVDIRYTLGQAQDGAVASPSTCAWLARTAKASFYPDRHWGTLLREAGRAGLPDGELAALRDLVRHTAPSVKRQDAIEALTRLATDTGSGDTGSGDTGSGDTGSGPGPRFAFEVTDSWRRLEQTEAPERPLDE